MPPHTVATELVIPPQAIPLLGSANVWIEESFFDQDSVRFTQWVIQQALAKTQPGDLEIWVYDEALCGVAAPFAAINEGGEKLLRSINNPTELKAALASLRLHLQGVNNVIQGRAEDLLSFRRQIGRSVEGYKLIVLSTDVTTLDDEALNHLATLLKVGPRLGVTFVIHSMTLDVNPFLLRLCDLYTVRDGLVSSDLFDSPVRWNAPDIGSVISTATAIGSALAQQPAESVPMSGIQDFSQDWKDSSSDGLTFSVGIYGEDSVDITIGDEVNQRHNMLVTGAVGQGKSNLISVIIHSLAQRYSPRELQFVLLDFKEGVTLQRFYDEESGEFLPHAAILGLEADRRFGLSVFEHLFSLYKERMKRFKAVGVQSIREYRKVCPEDEMPRILVIVDEFQMMFADNDRTATAIADLLKKAMRLYRACGIHFLLASQTIGGNIQLMGAEGEGVFAQIPIRIALKNSVSESQATLGINNNAAAHIRSRQAIVNLDYGEVSSNRKCSIAFADEEFLLPFRHQWWQAARDAQAPYVFDGEKRQPLLFETLTPSDHPVVKFGKCIDVGGRTQEAVLHPEVGRNIALFGSGEAPKIFVPMLASLVLSSPDPAKMTILNFAEANETWSTSLDELIQSLPSRVNVEVVSSGASEGKLQDLAMGLASFNLDQVGSRHIVAGAGMDRMRDSMSFGDLCKNGPDKGVHFIGWWLKFDTFQEQVGFGGGTAFDVRAVTGVDTQTARRVFDDPLLDWTPQNNRMLVWDSASMPDPQYVIPFSTLNTERQ